MTLVVACDLERGGTWEGAVQALRRGYGSVAAWVGPGAGPGNERLVELGAIAVDDVAAVLQTPVARSRDAARSPISCGSVCSRSREQSCAAPVSSPGDRR